MEKFESAIDNALKTLRNQGVQIGSTRVDTDGNHIYSIGDFLLTADQILMLRDENRLSLQGIKEFNISELGIVEKDVIAATKRIRAEELKNWTPGQICEYINTEFQRNHSVGQIAGVLGRLGIPHA